ncbi:MAG: FAD-binding oxidoreductase [Planctomycetes bacterium]|nr:FAD-binding oxidoreductase [Planctomycetota bacterium]
MDRSADVIVIGGGIMGLNVAARLAAARAGRVVLFEKRRFGAGESGKSGAILRQHYSHQTLIAMAQSSLAAYRALHERAPGGIGLQNPGMAFVCGPADRVGLERNVALQRSLGVEVESLDAAGLRTFEPRATFADGEIGCFERAASFVIPHLTLAAVAAQARAAGAELHEGCGVAAIEQDANRRATGVRLADGTRVAARTVVVCGGPWSRALLLAAGADLPLSAVAPEQAFFIPPAGHGPDRCIWADLVNDLYWKSETTGFTRVGRLSYEHDRAVPDPDSSDEGVSGAFLADSRARLARRVAGYREAVCWGGVAALYTVTPDAQALIGPVAGHDGLLVVSGFSGHGFKLGPSVGDAVTALVAGGDAGPFERDFFAPDRFARGARRSGAYGSSVLG